MQGVPGGFDLLWQWRTPLAWGALSTVAIAFFAYGLGLLIGLGGAVGKLSGGEVLKKSLEWYTTLVRSLPELLLIIVLYYLVSDLINQLLALFSVPPIRINGFVAAIVVLGFVQGAYHTEVLRGAIQAIPVGQLEAAKAYGMTPWLQFRRITLPAMLPNALPGLSNLWLNATKDSSLVFVVGFSELISTAKQAAGSSTTKHYFLFFCFAALVYLVISLISLWGFGRIEQSVRLGQHKAAR
jgi:polar amino acid transport system permease protein